MMAPEEALREQIRSLRIERDAPPPQARPRRRGRLVVVAVAIVAAAIVGYRLLGARPIAVRVVHARAAADGGELVAPVLSGAGYAITGEKYISIGVRVPGRIDRYLVDEGEHVKKGEPLVELDDRDYRAQDGRAEAALRIARANRDLATTQLARVRRLFDEGVASKEELDQAANREAVTVATVAQAENDLAQAKVNLEDTVLRSPVDGVILAKLKAVGEIAVPGGFAGAGDLLRLADLSEMRAEVDIGEADLGRVSLGQAAEVVPDAYPDRRYHAEVAKLYPQVNRQKGTLKVEVRIADPDERILPDMSVRVTFLASLTAQGGKGAPVVAPRAAVRRTGTEAYVWIVAAGRLARRPIGPGVELGEDVEITRGLSGGEALVIGPDGGFRDGVAVTVEPTG